MTVKKTLKHHRAKTQQQQLLISQALVLVYARWSTYRDRLLIKVCGAKITNYLEYIKQKMTYIYQAILLPFLSD